MRRARAVALAVLAFAACFLAFEARYYRRGAKLCHPTRKPVTLADKALARAHLPTLEEVSFRTADGLTLRGFYVPATNGATVVMGHGLGENRMHSLPDAEMLARHGYGSLLFDWRAHGESEGDASTWSDHEQLDFSAAIDFVAARPDVKDGHIAGMGFSIGASTVVLEAAKDLRVKAVILEAIYPSFDEEIKDKMGSQGALSWVPAELAMQRAGLDPSHIRPIDHIAELTPRPLLEITGARDIDTPVAIATRVFDRAAEPKRMWVVEGAGHGEYEKKAPVELEKVLTSFLDEAFFPKKEGG